jgi:REP element-mobilizing transposase RayT
VLTVKENQENLLADIKGCFARAAAQDFEEIDHDSYETTEEYCLMPNHFHLVLWPHKDGDLSRVPGCP